MKNKKKFIAALLSSAVMVSSFAVAPVFAETTKTLLNYTFEAVTFDPNRTVGNGTINFKADGYEHYALGYCWLDTGNEQFSQTSASAKSGGNGVQVTMASGNDIEFMIPKQYNESTTKTVKITVPVKQLSGNETYVFCGIDTRAHKWNFSAITGGAALNISSHAWVNYTQEVQLDLSKDHYISFSNNGGSAAMTAAFDDILVEEVLEEDKPVITSVTPANGKTGVSPMVNPVIVFDKAMSEPSFGGITLKNGSTNVEYTYQVNTAGTTITIIPNDKLLPDTTYTLSIPATVKSTTGLGVEAKTFTFTTGSRNLILLHDFEDEPVSDDPKTEYTLSSLWNSTAERTTEAAASGTHSLKISKINQANTNEIIARLPMMDNKQYLGRLYTISFKVKNAGAEAAQMPLQAYFRYYVNGKGTVNKLITNALPLNDEFYTLSYRFSVDETSDGEPVAIWNPEIFINEPVGGNDFYLDDFTLTSISNIMPSISASVPANGTKCDAPNSISITFGKKMDISSVINTAKYSINDSSVSIASVEKQDDYTFIVHFNKTLSELKDYIFGINGVTDEDGLELYDTIEFETLPSARLYNSEIKMLYNMGEYDEIDITGQTVEAGEVSALVSGIKNYSGEDKNIVLYEAAYEGDKLIAVDLSDLSVGADDTDEYSLTASLTVPEERTDYTLKAFLWNMDDQKPIEKAELSDYEVVHIKVAKDGTGDFDDISDANDSVSGNSAKKRFVIDIMPGIYEEVNLKPKAYVTLRGTDRDTCVIKGELSDDVSATASGRDFLARSSTLNMFDTADLENLTITARNLRYPVHDEGSGTNKDAIRHVKNCHIEHFGNDGATDYYINNGYGTNREDVWQWVTAWGYGTASGVIEVFDNTTFKSVQRAWYVHNNQKFDKRQVNIINNCVMDCDWQQDITVESLGSTTDDLVVLNNCTFNGLFIQSAEYPWINEDIWGQYATRRDYDIIVNNCDPIGYKPKSLGKALRIVSNSTAAGSKVEVSGSAADVLFGDAVAENGGGGISGYTYGYWDISGVLVGISSNKYAYNTIGRRLGDCSSAPKTLTVKFDGDENKKVDITFNTNCFYTSNGDLLSRINSAISSYGYADEYNVTEKEYYPTFTDKEQVLTNGSEKAIKRFAAVCIEDGRIRPMTSADPAASFAGVALENIIPGESGRILSEGYLYNVQLGLSDVPNGASITVTENGYQISGSGAAVMNCTNDKGWAYFNAE